MALQDQLQKLHKLQVQLVYGAAVQGDAVGAWVV